MALVCRKRLRFKITQCVNGLIRRYWMSDDQSWSTFLSDYGVGILLIITSAVGSAFIGFFEGRKVSSNEVGRKNEIYQPLINELTPISTYDLDVFSTIYVSFLREIICNNYKYVKRRDYFAVAVVDYTGFERQS